MGPVDIRDGGVLYTDATKFIINISLPGFRGQYGETLHSCAAFPLAYGSGNILVHTRAISRHFAHYNKIHVQVPTLSIHDAVGKRGVSHDTGSTRT